MSNEIKPIAYFRAIKEQGIVWGEDCCSEEVMVDGYDDVDEFSLPVYSADVVEALQKENAELKSKAIGELVEKSYKRKIKALEDEIEAKSIFIKNLQVDIDCFIRLRDEQEKRIAELKSKAEHYDLIEVTPDNQIKTMLYDTLIERDKLKARIAELEQLINNANLINKSV